MVATVGTPGAADPTSGTNASTTRSPGAPAATSNGTLLLGLEVVASAVNPGTTAPNWTVKYNSNAIAAGLTVIAVLWRRSTGTEPTPYSWSTGSGAGQSVAQIWPIEGELATGDPFHSSADFQRQTATSAMPTVSITSVPAGATLFWVGASGSARTLTTGPSIGGTAMQRLTPAGAQLYHLFKLEDYAGGSPSVSGLTITGGNTSQTAGLFAVLAAPPPNVGSASYSWTNSGTATGEAPDAGVSSGSAAGAWTNVGTATGVTTRRGSATYSWTNSGTAEGPVTHTEYVEDWADLASVTSSGVTVSGNRLYAANSSGDRGYVKPFTFPTTGVWRYQQLIYNVDAGLQNPTIKLGISCNSTGSGILATDPDAVGIAMQFGTRARTSFKGTSLSAVAIEDEQIVGVGPEVDATLLFDITADEHYISFSLKDITAVREMIAFRISRSDLANAGKTVMKIYAYFTDPRTTSGSSLSPFIFQTGTIGPATTTTVAGQLLEGAGQRIITTRPDDESPFQWWAATPPGMTSSTPIVIHCPQSLSGDGHDAWTDVRMESITTAAMDKYIWLSSTDTVDRFGNQVELDNYTSLLAWCENHFGGGRDVYLFGTSMGTMVCANLIGRGEIDARAMAVIGFAGGFDWLWNNVTSKRDEIEDAYGVNPDGSDLHTKTAGFDPLLSFIDDADWAGKGFRFYTGTSDTTTPRALSDDMSAILLDAGATEADVLEDSGGHLNTTQYHGDDVVAFYERNASPASGSASGSWTNVGTATGRAAHVGNATDDWTNGGTATGRSVHQGSTSAAWTSIGTASGASTHRGTASTSLTRPGTAAGRNVRTGSASGAWTNTGAAIGRSVHGGAAADDWTSAGSATGGTPRRGSAAGAWTNAGTATGGTGHAGGATGSWDSGGSADGFSGGAGFATGTWTSSTVATGIRSSKGTGVGTYSYVANATGTAEREGSAGGSWTNTGTAAGKRKPGGTASGSWASSGSADGGLSTGGAASGVWTNVGTANGRKSVGGFASGSWTSSGTTAGRKVTRGSASSAWTSAGNAHGQILRTGTASTAWTSSVVASGRSTPPEAYHRITIRDRSRITTVRDRSRVTTIREPA